MLLTLSIILGSALGTFLGNLTLFVLIGLMAQRQEKATQEKLQELQRGYLDMVNKEAERMKRYASMES